MKFIIQDEINAVQKNRQDFIRTCILDKQASLDAKANINTLLASPKGLLASFAAGFTKGMVNQANTTSKSLFPTLIQIMMKL